MLIFVYRTDVESICPRGCQLRLANQHRKRVGPCRILYDNLSTRRVIEEQCLLRARSISAVMLVEVM